MSESESLVESQVEKLVTKKELEVVGKPVPRIDAIDKVTGTARYGADYYFPNMAYGKVLRTQYPHAKILKVDTSKAEQYPGVLAVLTAKDVPGSNRFGVVFKDECILAEDKVRYMGDAIAIVAAVDEKTAEEALKLIKVEYEPLPVITDPLEAMKEDAPKIHEHGNVFVKYKIRKGDVKEGFEEADVIIEREYKTQFIDHGYLEPDAAVAVPSGDKVTVYGSFQHPHNARRIVALALGKPMSKVRIVQANLGGAFGGKDDTANVLGARAAILAVKLGIPVKMVYSREEVMIERYKRHPYIMRYKVGATKEGKLTAMEIFYVANGGAYASTTPLVMFRSTVQCTGPYDVPNVKMDGYGVYTNTPLTGAMRGFGSPQINFAVESLMDELAEKLGIDPLEIRLINAFTQGSSTPTGQILDGHVVSIRQVLKKAAEISNWVEKREKYDKQSGDIRRGIGLACSFRGVSLGAEGPDFAGAIVTVMEDGSIAVASGIAENGQGARTVLSQIAAEVFGVSIDYVIFADNDTVITPDSGPTVASRGTIMGGGAVKIAAEKVKKRMQEFAAKMWDIPVEQVVFSNEKVFDENNPENSISFRELANLCYRNKISLSDSGWFVAPEINWDPETGEGNPYFTYTYNADVAEVEVNVKTGAVKVLHVYAVHDCGRVVNPNTARGQVYGGVAMGLGYALTEEYLVDEKGYPITTNLDKYRLIRANEMPEVTVEFVENPDPNGPFGAKSLGEPATEVVAPAVINAIAHAAKVRVRDLPAKREKILSLLKKKEA